MNEKSVQRDEFHVSEQVQTALSLTSMGLLVIGKDRDRGGSQSRGTLPVELAP